MTQCSLAGSWCSREWMGPLTSTGLGRTTGMDLAV
uniref:Uncharacterized protein n=1 Tax=Anguilla anguilla TaxID=7936 RepID=A0A0E9XXS4_ANGAN